MTFADWAVFCWKTCMILAKNFQIFFQNMLLTLFYLERHVMESTNYFWELIFILMPTRVSWRFLLIGPSFAEKRVWFSQELLNFLQKYAAYTILSRKTCNGEQKLFWRINLHINAHKGIETIFAVGPSFAEKRVWFSKELPNFLQNMLLTLFYLERHVMECKNYFWELIFILMPTRVLRRFLLIGPSFAEKRVWFSQEFPNFLQKYVAYTILSRKTCDGEHKLFLRINLHIMPTRVSWRFLLIGPSFAEKRVWFSQELLNFLQKYAAYTILSRKTCNGEQKLFWRINLHINAHKGIETIFAVGPSFAEKRVWFSPEFQIFFKNMLLTLFYLERHVMESKNYFWELIFHINAHKGIEMTFADWAVFCWKTCII